MTDKAPSPSTSTPDLATLLTLLATQLHHSGAMLWLLLRAGASLEQARLALGLTDRHVRRLFGELQELALGERGEVCRVSGKDFARMFGKANRWELGRYYHRALDLNVDDVKKTRAALAKDKRETDLEDFVADSAVAVVATAVQLSALDDEGAARLAPQLLINNLPPLPDSLVPPALAAAVDGFMGAVDDVDDSDPEQDRLSAEMENDYIDDDSKWLPEQAANEPTPEDIITAGQYGIDWEVA